MENIPDWDIVVAYSFSGGMEKVSEENEFHLLKK